MNPATVVPQTTPENRPIRGLGLADAASALLILVWGTVFLATIALQPLWNDEAFSFFVAYDGIVRAMHEISNDTQPPLYYILTAIPLALSPAVSSLRILPVLSVFAGMGILFITMRSAVSPQRTLLYIALLVTHATLAYWAQRARPYPVQFIFCAIFIWGAWKTFLAPAERRTLPMAAYILGGAGLILTQYPGGFFVAGMCLAIALSGITSRTMAYRTIRDLIVLGLGITALCALVWGGGFIHQFATHLDPAAMKRRHPNFFPTADGLIESTSADLGVQTIISHHVAVFILYAVIALYGLWRTRQAPLRYLALGAFVFPFMICVLGWLLIHPAMGYVLYSAIWLVPGFVLLIALGIAALPRPLGALTLCAVLFLNLWGIKNLFQSHSVPLDQIAATIAAEHPDKDTIVLEKDEAARYGLAYYLGPPYTGRLAGLGVTDTAVKSDVLRKNWAMQTPENIAPYQRVWIVLPPGMEPVIPMQQIAQGRDHPFHTVIGGYSVDRFDRP